MNIDHICYNAQDGIIYGIGSTPDDAITDARYNARDPDVDTTNWRTAPATTELINRIHAEGGDCKWCINRATGIATTTP